MTVILALVSAFILSMTFIPAMVAIFIRGRVKEKQNLLMRLAERAYAPSLRLVLQYKFTVVLAAVAVFAASLILFGRLGQEFVPTLDEKDILVQPARIPSTSLTQSTKMQFEVEKTIKGFPEVAFVYSKTGCGDGK